MGSRGRRRRRTSPTAIGSVALVVVAAVVVLLDLLGRPGPAAAAQVTATCADRSTDARTIQSAIDASSPGDAVVLHGPCLVSSTIKLLGGRLYRGDSASTTLRAASGSNLPAVLASDSWLENRSYTGEPITLRDLTIDGNRAGNPKGGDAVVVRSWNSQIENLKIGHSPGNGLRIAASSRNGTAIRSGHSQVNGTISGLYVTDSAANGIYAQEAAGDNALTDWNLLDSWVGESGGSGIRLDNGAGWVVARNHVYDDAQAGISVERMFGTSISGNNVEDFGPGYAGIQTTLQGDAASEITGNRVFQAKTGSTGGTTFVSVVGVVYGTGDVGVTDNVVRGNGTGTGLSYSGGGNPLVVTSTGNSILGVTTPRTGVQPTTTY